ncbi:MAG: hypothetical protein KGL39_41660, partial [Patescibacteria group bacterium]|nr:hypothetical protein [Patescibacteria group bacterium]
DKSLPLGAANPDGTKNVDGRFAVHLHRDYWPGMSDKDPPVLVSGNFEEGLNPHSLVVAFRTFGWKTASRIADALLYSLDISFLQHSVFVESEGVTEEIVVGTRGIGQAAGFPGRNHNWSSAEDLDAHVGRWLVSYSKKLLKIGTIAQDGFQCVNLRGVPIA